MAVDERPLILAVDPPVDAFACVEVLLEHPCSMEVVFRTSDALRVLAQREPALLFITLTAASATNKHIVELARERFPNCPLMVAVDRSYSICGSVLPNTSLRALYDMPVKPISILDDIDGIIGLCGAPKNPHVRDAVNYISQHLRESLRMSRIANCSRVSAGRLAHLFQEHLQLSVHAYCRRVRVHAARLLLRSGEGETVGEIAAMTGFCDAGHMSRTFAEVFGVRPGAYRLQMMVRNGAVV